MNQKAALEAAFCFAGKKKPTAQAVGKDNSGWMFTDSESVCRPVGKKQRSRREASESVHLIELNERKLVVTDGLGNKFFIINPNKQVRNVHRIRTGNPE